MNKQKQNQKPVVEIAVRGVSMKRPLVKSLWISTILFSVLLPWDAARGATIFKTDTPTMNTSADWVGGTNAAIEHVGRFDTVISAINALGLSLGSDLSLGGLIFTANMKGPVLIAPGNTLTLGASGIDMSAATQPVTFSNNVSLNASQTWNLGRPLTVNGAIDGAAGNSLTISGSSTLTLTASNTCAGATLINAGTFTIGGATGSVANSDITLAYGTTFNFNSVPGTPLPMAIRGKGLTVNGATMLPLGPGANDVNDVFTGPFTIGQGYTTVTVNPDASPKKNVRLTFSSLARSAGGVVFFRGTLLGSSTISSRTAGQGNIEFVTPPTLVGGGGAFGTVTNSIIPFAVGGEWNHLWNDYFVTYDPLNGIRRITTYATSITDGSTTANNVQLTTAVAGLNGTTTINALKLGAGGSVDGSGELRLTSGALLASKSSGIGTNTAGTLAFGTAEGIVSIYDNSVTLTLGSAVTGTRGFTKATLGTLNLMGPVNVGDPIRFMSGTLNVGNTITGPLSVGRSATLNLFPGSVVNGSVDLSLASTGNSMGGAIVGTLTQDAGIFNLSSNATIVGTLSVVGSTVNITNSSVVGNVIVGPNNRAGNLNLNSGSSVTGVVFNQSGTVNLNTGGAISGAITNNNSFNFNSASDYMLNTPFDGSGTLYQKSTTGKLTLYQSPGTHQIGTLTPSSGATLILDGAADTYTTVSNRFDPAGGLFIVNNGTWAFHVGDNAGTANIRLNGGTLTVTPGSARFALNNSDGSTLTIAGGALIVPSTVSWGLRIGNIHGSWHNSGNSCTGVQSGGVVRISNNSGFELGSFSNGKTSSYDLSGGEIYVDGGGVPIGSATNASSATFTLRNTGKLVSAASVRGVQSYTNAIQVFSFQGGTLAVSEYQAANLRPTAVAATGTLFNAGGTLAPGDIGTPGRTWITGNYTSAPNAVLAFDIGGTAQANAFTNTTGYDYVYVNNGRAALDGKLQVSLIRGFTPSAANTFDVLTCGGTGAALSGGFSNTPGNQVWATDGYSRFDVSNDTVNLRVRLSNYALNQWALAGGGMWSNSSAWSLSVPTDSNNAAYFGGMLATPDTVTLHTALTLRGLTFANAVSYTLAGSGTLTLSGNSATASQITVALGSHTVALPLALTDALAIEVTREADTLTLSGSVTGGQPLTKSGAGVLALSGNNALGRVTVSAGIMKMTGGNSTFDALSIATNAVFSFYQGTLTLVNGLTVWAGGAFNFQSYGGGRLLLKRGTTGGSIDTVAEVNAAITDGRFTVKGQAASTSVFSVSEDQIDGVWYVSVKLKTYGTIIRFQ